MIVKLTSEIKYSKKGGTGNKTFEVELVAPSRNDRKFCRQLKQRVSRALTDVVKQYGGDTNNEQNDGVMPTGDEIMAMLSSCNPDILDYGEFCEKMEKSMLPFINIDDGISLKPLLSDQISSDDWELIIGEWIVNFILESQVKKVGTD